MVVGAAGFLGRSVVRAFSSAGYEVRGLVRDSSRSPIVREDGGRPVVGDVRDLSSLEPALSGCAGAVHLAANPSDGADPRAVRVDGTRRLVEAGRRAGIARLVVGSGYWVYGGRSEPIDEHARVDPRGESRINYDAERVGQEANRPAEFDVLVARPGMVYGAGSWFAGLAGAIREGTYRVVGTGENRWSFVDRWDAGRAFLSIYERGAPGEVYNVVDDRPAPLREFADFVASTLGVPPPPSISLADAAHEMDATVARHLATDRPTSSARLSALGWRPRIPSYRDGVPDVLRELYPT